MWEHENESEIGSTRDSTCQRNRESVIHEDDFFQQLYVNINVSLILTNFQFPKETLPHQTRSLKQGILIFSDPWNILYRYRSNRLLPAWCPSDVLH